MRFYIVNNMEERKRLYIGDISIRNFGDRWAESGQEDISYELMEWTHKTTPETIDGDILVTNTEFGTLVDFWLEEAQYMRKRTKSPISGRDYTNSNFTPWLSVFTTKSFV